jgi:hypothetical protein
MRNIVYREREKMMHLPVPPPWLPGAEMKTEEPIDRSRLKRYFKSLMHVLSGLFIIGIGIFLLVVNAGSPYKEITGHVQEDMPAYSQDGQSRTSYLRISTDPNDLFILDKNALQPTWNGQFFKNERVDVYYSGDTPKRIVALQVYDLFGRPTTKFTTTDYINSQNASPISNVGLDIGVILVLLGVSYLFCWAAIYVKGKLGQSPGRTI